MALPSDKISTSLVGQTLGASSRDVGTLCTHPNINKWAKFKPIRNTKVVGLIEQDYINANYGLQPQEDSQIKTYQWYNTGTLAAIIQPAEWEYYKPMGGASSPYRIGDFRGYNHDALPPIIDVDNVQITQQNVDEYLSGLTTSKMWYPSFKFGSQSYQVIGQVLPNMEIPFYNFNLIAGSPITDGNWRMGLAIFKDGKYYIATSEEPFSGTLDANNVWKVFVNLFKNAQVRNILFAMSYNSTIRAIPFFGYKLQYDPGQDGWFFNTGVGSRGFYFPLGNIIDITRIEYPMDIKISYMSVSSSNESGIFTGSVNFQSPARVQGSLYNIKAGSPTTQQLFIRTAGVTGAVTIDLNKTGTRLQFQKTNQEWIDLQIQSINGTTSGVVTLNTGSNTNEFITVPNAALKTYLGSLDRYGTGSAYYMGGLRLLNQDVATVKVYALSKIGDSANKWFQYDVLN